MIPLNGESLGKMAAWNCGKSACRLSLRALDLDRIILVRSTPDDALNKTGQPNSGTGSALRAPFDLSQKEAA